MWGAWDPLDCHRGSHKDRATACFYSFLASKLTIIPDYGVKLRGLGTMYMCPVLSVRDLEGMPQMNGLRFNRSYAAAVLQAD